MANELTYWIVSTVRVHLAWSLIIWWRRVKVCVEEGWYQCYLLFLWCFIPTYTLLPPVCSTYCLQWSVLAIILQLYVPPSSHSAPMMYLFAMLCFTQVCIKLENFISTYIVLYNILWTLCTPVLTIVDICLSFRLLAKGLRDLYNHVGKCMCAGHCGAWLVNMIS